MDSGYCDNLTPEVTTESSAAKRARNADQSNGGHLPRTLALIRKFITEKKVIVVAIVIIIALLIAITALTVPGTKAERCPFVHSFASQGFACPDFWIGYLGKCFYVSKEERNWPLSLETCTSFNASLAVIDTQKELDANDQLSARNIHPSIPRYPVRVEEASWMRSEMSSKKNQGSPVAF